MSKQYQRLLNGQLYETDQRIKEMKTKARQLYYQFNLTTDLQVNERQTLIKDLFGKVGKNYQVKPPFYCSHGEHISVGDNFFCNFNCIFLDLNTITIGNDVMLGPRVSIYTAAHPIDAAIRNTGLEYALPVRIEDNVWIGGDVVINPGVTIGQGSIIGSGSVITKDIPANVIAFGNPCKVHRLINEEDKLYWQDLYMQYLDDCK